MPFSRLTAIHDANARILAQIAEGNPPPAAGNPYYGYYPVDIFDCPPFVMFTNNDCPRALDILYGGKFEMGSMALWCARVRSATAILDIGAHVGVYALAAAALRRDVEIHAFEPNPYAFARLRLHATTGAVIPVDRLSPAAMGGQDFNHFLTTNPDPSWLANGPN